MAFLKAYGDMDMEYGANLIVLLSYIIIYDQEVSAETPFAFHTIYIKYTLK